MSDQIYLSDSELGKYGLPEAGTHRLGDRARALLAHQNANWPMLQKGASTLDRVEVKTLEFDGFQMKLQFNPGRIVSSSAKVDARSIAERKCFLCLENLPGEQRGVAVEKGNYVILVNPFPIFREHFTIPHKEHIPQLISGAVADMADISREMGERYTLFYNGPKCGASAPDHLHFQAGERGFMLMDAQWPELVERHGAWIRESSATRVASVDDGLRRFVVIDSEDRSDLLANFSKLYTRFELLNSQVHPGADELEEPMLNILCSWSEGRWTMIIFLRRKHRPWQYFESGEDRILFSPASVDFGGVCITPVEKDFQRIDNKLLADMFSQLSVSADILRVVTDDF